MNCREKALEFVVDMTGKELNEEPDPDGLWRDGELDLQIACEDAVAVAIRLLEAQHCKDGLVSIRLKGARR